jgi:hypothetical protein
LLAAGSGRWTGRGLVRCDGVVVVLIEVLEVIARAVEFTAGNLAVAVAVETLDEVRAAWLGAAGSRHGLALP